MGNNKESYFHNAPVSAPGLGAHLISSNRLVSIGSPLRLRSPAGSLVSRRYLGEGEGRWYLEIPTSPRIFSAVYFYLHPSRPSFMPCLPLALAPTQRIFATCINPAWWVNPSPARANESRNHVTGGSSLFLFRRGIIQINQAVFACGQIIKCIRNV